MSSDNVKVLVVGRLHVAHAETNDQENSVPVGTARLDDSSLGRKVVTRWSVSVILTAVHLLLPCDVGIPRHFIEADKFLET